MGEDAGGEGEKGGGEARRREEIKWGENSERIELHIGERKEGSRSGEESISGE